ncbi:MAG TPA: ROK family transcriptional regulator [Limnochorda sp.]
MARDRERPVKGSGKLIKSLNRSRILEHLQHAGPLSRVELAERTGISLPAVSHLVREMQDEGLIVCVGEGESSGGRRPALFAYNARLAYVVGLDLGATKLAGGISDLDGNLVATATIPTHAAGGSAQPVQERVKGLVLDLVGQAGVDLDKVMGIGIGVPGIPDPEGRVVSLAPGLARPAAPAGAGPREEAGGTASEQIPLGDYLREELALPVYMENDVNTVLRGEHWKGALQGASNAVCVMIGTGIGVGLLVNGQVYRGAHGAAGEIGYWLIGALGPIARPAGYGPLETFAAGPGIACRFVARLRASGRSSMVLDLAGGNEEAVTARIVAEAAAMGDPLALDVWRETAEMVGVALANLCSLVDPEVLVVGGGVARAPKHLFLDPVRQIVETLVPYPPNVVASDLGELAGILGAVATVLDSRRDSISYVRAGVGV